MFVVRHRSHQLGRRHHGAEVTALTPHRHLPTARQHGFVPPTISQTTVLAYAWRPRESPFLWVEVVAAEIAYGQIAAETATL